MNDLRHNVERLQPPLVLLDLGSDHRLRKLHLFTSLIEVGGSDRLQIVDAV